MSFLLFTRFLTFHGCILRRIQVCTQLVSLTTFPLRPFSTRTRVVPINEQLARCQQLYMSSPRFASFQSHHFGQNPSPGHHCDPFDLIPEPYQRRVPLAKSSRERQDRRQYESQSEMTTSPALLDQSRMPFPSHTAATQISECPPATSTRNHVPRPPNAFMLFRSDFLKRGTIPANVERRQQNLSRIAGECWNLLSQEEKGKWQEKAAKVLVEHQKQNPDYKFTPSPRGSRRPKSKGHSDLTADSRGDEGRIRQIRERYTQLVGPAATPMRRKRSRAQDRLLGRTVGGKDSPYCQAVQISLPPSISPSPSMSSPAFENGIVPFLPQHSLSQAAAPRRPSTSLGFSTPTPAQCGFSLARPSSAAFSDTSLSLSLGDLHIVRGVSAP